MPSELIPFIGGPLDGRKTGTEAMCFKQPMIDRGLRYVFYDLENAIINGQRHKVFILRDMSRRIALRKLKWRIQHAQ